MDIWEKNTSSRGNSGFKNRRVALLLHSRNNEEACVTEFQREREIGDEVRKIMKELLLGHFKP